MSKQLEQYYGIGDSNDWWQSAMAMHLKNELRMTPLTADAAYSITLIKVNLTRTIATYANNTIATGNFELRKNSKGQSIHLFLTEEVIILLFL